MPTLRVKNLKGHTLNNNESKVGPTLWEFEATLSNGVKVNNEHVKNPKWWPPIECRI